MGTKDTKNGGKIKKNVFWLGVASLLTDVSSEMLFPILPLFVVAVAGASMVYVGFMEGAAALVIAILNPISGWLADKSGNKKLFSISGYAISTLGKSILLFTSSKFGVLSFRIIDRIGKGIRTAPRDAIIAESVSEKERGKYFGIHRAMDTIGAILGIISLLAILFFMGNNKDAYKLIFLLALIPAALAVVIQAIFVHEPQSFNFTNTKKKKLSFLRFSGNFKIYLAVMALSSFGQLSYPFFLLRAREAGIEVLLIPVFYLLMNLFYAAVSIPGGIIADKKGKRFVLLLSFLIFIFLLLGFALTPGGKPIFWILFAVYGIFNGLFDGVSRAYVADFVKKENEAYAFGFIGMVQSFGLFFGNFIAGVVWHYIGSVYSFIFSAVPIFISILLLLKLKEEQKPHSKYIFDSRKFKFYR